MEGLNLLMEAIRESGHEAKVQLGMDVAASEFFKDNLYDLDFKNPQSTSKISGGELSNLYKTFATNFPMASIEDPFD
jgi:enolase